MSEDYDYLFKVVIDVNSPGLFNKCMKEIESSSYFNKNENNYYHKTIGTSFYVLNIKSGNSKIKCQTWLLKTDINEAIEQLYLKGSLLILKNKKKEITNIPEFALIANINMKTNLQDLLSEKAEEIIKKNTP